MMKLQVLYGHGGALSQHKGRLSRYGDSLVTDKTVVNMGI